MDCPNCGAELPTFGGIAIMLTEPPLPRETVLIGEDIENWGFALRCSECVASSSALDD